MKDVEDPMGVQSKIEECLEKDTCALEEKTNDL